MKTIFNDTTLDIKFMSYTMDYDSDEIVMRIMVNDNEFGEVRLCERDAKRIYEWFELAKFIKKNRAEESNES